MRIGQLSTSRRALLVGAALGLTTSVAIGIASSDAAASPAQTTTTAWQCDSFTGKRTELRYESDHDSREWLEVDQFDESLGDFLAAEYSFSVSARQSIATDVYADPLQNPYYVEVTTTTRVTLGLPVGALTATVSATAADDVVSDGDGADGEVSGFSRDLTDADSTGILTSEDTGWVGDGSIGGWTTTLSGLQVLGAGGNLMATQETFISGEFCVRYLYIAEPEPTPTTPSTQTPDPEPTPTTPTDEPTETPDPEPTPTTPTDEPTETPDPEPSGEPSATPEPSSSTSSLAQTGAEMSAAVGTATALVICGAALLALARRRG